jgi:hypothetical protein
MVFTVISLFALPTERKLLFTCIDGNQRVKIQTKENKKIFSGQSSREE